MLGYITKNIITKTGATISHWEFKSLSFDPKSGKFQITFSGWIDKQAFDEGLRPAASELISQEDFENIPGWSGFKDGFLNKLTTDNSSKFKGGVHTDPS